MHKLAITFAITMAMLFGSLASKAEAETWRGAGDISTAAQSFAPIQQASCYRADASLYLLSGKVLVRSLSVGNTTVELRQIAVAARDESQRRPWRGRMP